ncbi:MAG: ABC transporter permease [ANME-2 cluster archaeon]|nr:ABC transporter permease [ANME-2 cluster archaeon]MBC2706626.1 ABC transporter permease [ANME-2 cluster archaeon]MBC2746280.1 ABC transporter permease [ANME-2 cluster archaeon]MBC2763468.1 ABC transporter permease [ANME-2 cluster archaeon]
MKFHIIAAKDLKIILRDRNALIMMFLVPMMIISVAGMALGGQYQQNMQINVLIVDLDNDEVSRGLVEFLEEIDILNVDMESNEFAARDRVKNQEYGRLIIIPLGFTESVMTGQDTGLLIIADPTKESDNTVLEKIVEGYASRISTNVVVVKTASAYGIPVHTEEQILEIIDTAGQFVHPPPVDVTIENTASNLVEFSPFTQYVPGFAVMFLMFTTVQMGSISLIKEQEAGTLRRLITAPISKAEIIGGKIASTFIRGFVQLTVLIYFGHVAFDLDLGSDILALFVLIAAVTLASTGLGVLVAVLVKTVDQADSISLFLVMIMSAIGGSWWPLSVEPQFMQNMAHFTITAWAMDGFYDLLYFDLGLAGILEEVKWLVLMMIIFFGIAIRRFKFE